MKKFAIGIGLFIGFFFTFSEKAHAQYWNGPVYPILPSQQWNLYGNQTWGWNTPTFSPIWNTPSFYQYPLSWQQWNGYGWITPINVNATIPLNRGGWINIGFGNGYWGW